MPGVIAFCGFLGAWLLVIGPLGHAVRELEKEEFERDSFACAEQQVKKPRRSPLGGGLPRRSISSCADGAIASTTNALLR